MDTITIRHHSHDQFETLVGRRRVAYICLGEGKPINFLPRSVAGVELTDSEKLEVAKEIRDRMRVIQAEKDATSDELARITGRNYKPKTEDNVTDERSDSEFIDETEDEGSPSP